MKKYMLMMLVTATVTLAGCSSGTEDEGGGEVRQFNVSSESHRLGALHRTLRDFVAVLMPYTKNSATLASLDGMTVPCRDGGDATYDYDASRAPQQLYFHATFSDCLEAVGLIDGALHLSWTAGSEDVDRGGFGAEFSGLVTVDGTVYSIPHNSTFTSITNNSSGTQDFNWAFYPGGGLQGSNGSALGIQYMHGRVQKLAGDPTVNVYDAKVELQAPNGSGMNISITASCNIDLGSGVAAWGVGNPRQCGYNYYRGPDSGVDEALYGTATTNQGLLTFSVSGQRTDLSDAGQFDWPSLVATANFNPDGV